MTTRIELNDLQEKAWRAGRICTFFIDTNNFVNKVFYLDSKSRASRLRAGYILDPLSFAEKERAAPAWYQI